MELVSVAAVAENSVPGEYEGTSSFSAWDERDRGPLASVENDGVTREEWFRTGDRED